VPLFFFVAAFGMMRPNGTATLAGVLTGALCVAALGSQVLLTRGH